jgi:hypothetical protein
MLSFRSIKTNPSARDLRNFGLTVLIGFAIVACVLRFGSGKVTSAYVAGGVGLALGIGAFVPGLGRILYIAWMGLGIVIGSITSPIVLAVVYAVVFVPAALVMKILGRDALRRRIDRSSMSYWEPYRRATRPQAYFRQY